MESGRRDAAPVTLGTELPPLVPNALAEEDSHESGRIESSRASRLRTPFGMRSTSATDNPALGRRTLLVIAACFIGISLAQSPGLIETDTKLPMNMTPDAYFGGLFHLWNPTVFGGTVEQGLG